MLLVPKPVCSWASQVNCEELCLCSSGTQHHAGSKHILQIDLTLMYQKNSSFKAGATCTHVLVEK